MSNNTKYGLDALKNNSGTNNTAVGAYTSYNNLDASNNTAVGSNSAYYTTTGSNNTSLGAGSLCNNTTGALNTAIGSSALEGPLPIGSVGNQNTAVGVQALYINQGNLNTSIGAYSSLGLTGGSYNTFLGANTSATQSNFNYSTAIGYGATVVSSNEIMMGGNASGSYPDVMIPGSAYLPNFTTSSIRNDQIVPKSYIDSVVSKLNAGRGLDTEIINQELYLNVNTNLNFVNFLDSNTSDPSANGTLSLGTNTNNRIIIGPTGTIVPIQAQSIIQAQKGITGATGSFTSLTVSENTTFSSLPTCNETPNQDSQLITKGFADATYTTSGNIISSNNTWLGFNTFNKTIFGPSGITGATGSFTSLTVSENTTFSSLPTCNEIPNQDSQLITKGFADATYTTSENIVSSNNTWLGINTFNKTIFGPSGITGATGSFTNLQTSNDANINTITVGLGGGNIGTNTALGLDALISNTTGEYNTAVGCAPLLLNTTGSNNIAVGYESLLENTEGNNNCALGVLAIYNNKAGSNNCAFGMASGSNLYGQSNNNTFLGYQTNVTNIFNTYTQSTALGANAIIDASNQIVLGTSTESIKIPGSYVGIGGNYNPGNGYALDVNGTGHFTGKIIGATGSFTNLSASQQISAPGGITGATGSFTNLSVSQKISAPGGITGATGSFTNLSASQQISAPGGITGATGSFTNLSVSEQLAVLGGITGATGSFTNISVSEQLAVPGGITGATGSFSYLNSSNNTYLATTAGKMVGIGTNTPETKLHIVDYSSNTILTLQAYPFVSDENALIGGIIFNNGGANSSIQSCVNLGGANNNSDLRFYTSLDYNNTNLERMRISRSGNVGIGTKTPLYTLDISGNLQTSKDSNINTITVGLGGGNISSNVALGNKPLVTNTTGSNNVAVGSQSLFKSLSGSNNVAVGSQALYNDISGYNNVAVGYQALYNDISGNNNVAVGYQALRAVVSGLNNVAVGYNALASTINSNNCAVGFQSLVNNTTGYNNCAFGVNSLLNNIVGFQNVAVGYTALFNHRSNNNTACGFQSGISDISGNNNTYLGFKTNIDNSNNVYTQSTALGANAIIDASNQIVLGTSTESIKIPGSYVGIGGNYNPTSGYALDVSGNGNFTGQVNISGTISWGNYVKGMGIPGAWLINASAPNVPMPTPVYTSCTNMYNLFNQTVTSGNISPNDGINGAGGVGYYFGYQYFQVVDYVVVYPSYGIIAWDNINWTGSTILNFNNKTSTPVCVEPVSANTMYSFKLFFLGVQI